ncbi:hypothetical protein KL86DPRO_20396 [uncultured delta proteobacterium]|uniref:Uncharacterized protein n=1 Tax=uncultured delta proteobacterium TaxID=34034 RepID=A0A212JZL8_9DELT|nr:hypothetical protein KL86DPRO_20396 [uncultured delta proteobacterium]
MVCEGTPTPALNGGNECRLRLRGGLLSKRTLSTTSKARPAFAGRAFFIEKNASRGGAWRNCVKRYFMR